MKEIFGLHWSGFCSSNVGEALGTETDELWWITRAQCGAFSSADWDEVDTHLEKFWFKVPSLENTDVVSLRPSALSVGAHLMKWDEWAYLLGFHAGDEEEATLLASELANLSMPHEIWSRVGNSVELFVDDFAGAMLPFSPRAATGSRSYVRPSPKRKR